MLGPGKRVFRLPWRTPDSDVDAELRFHFEERVAELVGEGRSAVEARALAAGELPSIRLITAPNELGKLNALTKSGVKS